MLCLCRNGNCTDVDPYFTDMKSLCCACAVVETALTSILIYEVWLCCACAVVETALTSILISEVWLCCACVVVETALTSILISKVTMLCHCAVVETALRLTLISKVTMLCLCRSGNWLYLIIIYNVFLVGREWISCFSVLARFLVTVFADCVVSSNLFSTSTYSKFHWVLSSIHFFPSAETE